MNQGKLDIYKASAGSGKTHTLTHKYISFLTSQQAPPDAYKHILAVTFTNKATEEMKRRIVATLHAMSATNPKAKQALTAILHDYSNFQVSTIDKFFQQIFRSFARELGSFANYRVELRDEEVLGRVIDRMLSALDDEDSAAAPAAYATLNDFALEQLRYKSKSRYQDQLLEFAKLFLREDFKLRVGGYNADAQNIARIQAAAGREIELFESRLKGLAKEALEAIAEQGLGVSDFIYGDKGAMGNVAKYAAGDFGPPGTRLIAASESDPECWFAKKDAASKSPAARAACNRGSKPGLDTLLGDIVNLVQRHYADYMSALIIRGNAGAMKVFGGIYDALGKYLKENNIMLLGETTHALHKMIGGSDTPFIYERVGSWIDNFLLDEFQDFSLMQWANFRPLLEQSLDSGHDDLIVGDVKQSIYRWRGSDWNTLDSGVETELGGKLLCTSTLGTNYRSEKAIVDFNNMVFSRLTDPACGSFDGDGTIARAYSDCVQSCNASGGGYVRVTFAGSDGEDDGSAAALACLKGEIEALDGLGYPRSSVYILVRTNAEAAQAASQLISDGIEVITEESLYVGVSACVQRIVAVLKYMVNSSDQVNAQVMGEIGVDVEKLDKRGNSLYDVCENVVRSMGEDLLQGEMPYLVTFMDLVLDYMRDYGSDMAGFVRWWEEVGKKQTVSAPRGADAVRIMTIHKAKGLGCPVVIMPFFNESLTPSSLFVNYMWCEDKSNIQAGLVPVEFKKEVGESRFADDYKKEALFYEMDALNTAYVAFTRAEKELIVYAKRMRNKKGISDMLYGLLKDSLHDGVYVSGIRSPYVPKQEDGQVMGRLQLSSYNSVPMEGNGEGRSRLQLVYRGNEFFLGGQIVSPRARGIVLHDILASINSEADIAAAVSRAVVAGELPQQESAATEAMLRDMLAQAAPYGWFSPEAQHLNEASIVDTDGKVYRPDRVIIRGSRATVVDYKFGTRHGGYAAQVRRYVSMLGQMGYSPVEGYLWYAAENKIEKVA